MSKPVVILDLDRTLFKTTQFYDDLKRFLADNYHIDTGDFAANYDDYHPKSEVGLHHYDFFRQISDMGMSADEVEQRVEQALAKDQYLYDDVPAFLEFLSRQPVQVLILTYGEERFQQLKYHCVPAFKPFQFVAILESKADYIAQHFPDRPGLIIDDQLVEALPSSFQHIWLQRQATPEPETYNSLSDIQAAWPNLL